MGQVAPIVMSVGEIAGAIYTGVSLFEDVTGVEVFGGQTDPNAGWVDSAERDLQRGFSNYVRSLAAVSPMYTVKYSDDVKSQYDRYHQRQSEREETGYPQSASNDPVPDPIPNLKRRL